jgi:hypothetical protein
MDAKTSIKKKLVVPAALAVVVLASGCGNAQPSTDAGPAPDAFVADAGAFDAGCVPPEVYDPISRTCVPVV